MKLNPDCVRDILLTLESKTEYGTIVSISTDDERLRSYTAAELLYHLNQCEMTGFFYNPSWDLSGNFSVMDITPSAHEFLANIRNDTNWNKVKDVSKKIGSDSLSVIKDIAIGIISEIVKGSLNA